MVKLSLIILGLALIGKEPALHAQENRALGFFPLRSQSPIQQLRFGIQHHPPWTLDQGNWALQLQHTWKNMWLYDERRFLMDGEIHETVFRAAYGVTSRFEVMVEWPVRYLSGGVLDGAIEGFHRMMGLGQAGRDKFPRNRFVVEMIVPGENGEKVVNRSSDSGWQLGNLVLSVTRSLLSDTSRAFQAVITGNLKFPTATTTEMFGSQKLDVGLSLGSGYRWRALRLYYNAGILYFGDKAVMGLALRQWRFSSLFAVEYHPNKSRHSWVVQGLVESGVAKHYGQFSDRTSEVVFGYKRRVKKDWTVEAGFLENLFYFDNSPDVALHVAVTRFIRK
ncbi:MAG: DUF3187 family protein [Calditrichaeota bacterium]|nr:DUF3187 family protein [Calditrichota bacterium]